MNVSLYKGQPFTILHLLFIALQLTMCAPPQKQLTSQVVLELSLQSHSVVSVTDYCWLELIDLINRSKLQSMTTTPQCTALAVPPLTGTNYCDWSVACTTAAKKCLPTNGPLGGLGLLLAPSDYAALNAGTPYTLAVKPNAVTNQATAHAQLVYDREQTALGTLTAAIFESIPLPTKQACSGYHPQYGTSFIALHQMMAHVYNKFGNATIHGYNVAKTSLERPFTPGMDIDDYLASHVEAHIACSRAGNALNDIMKLEALINGIGGRSGPFQFTIAKFEEDTTNLTHRRFEDTPAIEGAPEIRARDAIDAIPADADHDEIPARPAQDHVPGRPEPGHLGLATRIRMAAQRLMEPAAPTTRGYFGAAAVTPANLRQDILDTIKEALCRTVGDTAATANAANNRDRRGDRRNMYCWTHGQKGHTGAHCKNPAPGHDPRATVNNRRGGSNFGCKK